MTSNQSFVVFVSIFGDYEHDAMKFSFLLFMANTNNTMMIILYIGVARFHIFSKSNKSRHCTTQIYTSRHDWLVDGGGAFYEDLFYVT